MKSNPKKLIIFLVILLGISYYVLRDNHATSDEIQFLIPELKTQINDVNHIVLSKNNKTINLIKESGQWKVTEADNYLADANKIANLLLNLRKIKLKDQKTSNPQYYEKLSLAETGNNAATKIILKNAQNLFADISIGKKAKNSQGIYVRKNTQTQTWLAEGTVNIKLDAIEWIVSTILDIEGHNIKSITYQSIDSAAISINKLTPKDLSFALVDMPQGMQIKEAINLDDFANGLQKFSIESATVRNKQLTNPELSVSYQLFSGMQYNLYVYNDGESYYLNIDLENADSASEIENQIQNWTYVIPSYKFNALNKKLTDIIETIPTPVNSIDQ